VLVGDVNASKVMSEIEDKFGGLKSSSKEIQEYKKEKDRDEHYLGHPSFGKHLKIHGNTKSPMFMMAYQGEPLGTHKAYVMDILSSILGTGASSYLHQKYVKNKRPILNNISVSNFNMQKSGVFFISGELAGRSRLSKVRKILIKETKRICDKAIDDRAVQKTKNQFLVQYYAEIQSNSGVARFIGSTEKYYGDYKHYQKELEIYESITTDEVKKVCREIFKNNEQVFVSVWNKHKKVKGH